MDWEDGRGFVTRSVRQESFEKVASAEKRQTGMRREQQVQTMYRAALFLLMDAMKGK